MPSGMANDILLKAVWTACELLSVQVGWYHGYDNRPLCLLKTRRRFFCVQKSLARLSSL